MIRFPCRTVYGVLMLACPWLCAESNGPLESSKQELRKLEGTQQTKTGPSATEGLRPSLPSIQTPGQDALPPMPLPDAEKLEKERKRRQKGRENWLVNGVEQLEKSEKKESGIPRESENGGELDLDKSAEGNGDDPQYLLKLYDEQKKMDEGRASGNTPQRSPRADPLAPFLQGWLGNSPVRGQFFDEFVRKPSEATAGQITIVSQSQSLSDGFVSNEAASSAAGEPELRPNPYLAPLNTPARNAPDITPGVFPSTTSTPLAPSSFRLPLPSATPAPVLRQPERKPPPAPSADDRKYFPQLKKF
jgi:hypothetical protein